jgi:glycosyltransferase involved in cell wall biosynthesis
VRILYVSDSTTVSGAEIVVLGYLDALRERGHEAFGFVHGANTRLQRELNHRGVPFTATTAYSRRIIATTPNPLALAEFARAFASVARSMAAGIRAQRIDVVHAISYPASLYTAFAAATTRVPHVWHEHNIKRLHAANRPIYRAVAATCRWVVGPSDAVTGNLARAGIPASRLRTVYNGIDLGRFAPSDSEVTTRVRGELDVSAGEVAIGLFGQMLPYKGQMTLIEAAPAVLEHHPHARFFLVGALENPPYEQQLRSAIAAAGLTHRFRFTGWRADVQDVMRAMDVVVVGTTTPEPAALALMEAMALQRPLVATRTGGTPEIVVDGETGLLYTPGDAADLARRIRELLDDPALGRRLGTAGRARMERHFSRERHFDEMLRLYERAVEHRTHR